MAMLVVGIDFLYRLRRVKGGTAGRAAAENLDAAAGALTDSPIVFHSPQSGHFPAHFAVS